MYPNLTSKIQLVLSLVFAAQALTGSISNATGSPQAELGAAILMNEAGIANVKSEDLVQQALVNKETIVSGRRYIETTLKTIAGDIQILINTPQFVLSPMPAVVLAGGFQTGKEVASFLNGVGDNIVIGYQYPLNVDMNSKQIPPVQDVIKALKSTSCQLAIVLRWLNQVPWIDSKKISTFGVSLGTLFWPSAIYIAEKIGFKSHGSIFAYGGADISQMLVRELARLGVVNANNAEAVKQFARLILTPLDPMTYLPSLKGPFLVVRASDDEVFPIESQQALFNGLAAPKEEFIIPGPHINSDKPELIKQTIEKSRAWLINKGLIQ